MNITIPVGALRRASLRGLVRATALALPIALSSAAPAADLAPPDGHLANFVGEPNRYALPAFYELHVWAWEENPSGSFSDWNPRVSCERQPTSPRG